MRKWKKGCAGLLTAAMAIGMIAPGAAVTADAENTSVPALTPKYEMKLDGSLDVTVNGADQITPDLRVIGNDNGTPPAYDGTEVYSYDSIAGQAINIGSGNNYGVMMDGVMVDSSYTVTFYVKSTGEWTEHSPVCAIGQSNNVNNWMTFAGQLNGNAKLWSSKNWTQVGEAFAKPSEWTQYAISVDGTNVKLYENGNLLRSGTDLVTMDTTNGLRVMFGVSYWDATPNCLIDEVKIYDEALDATQAELLYKGGAAVIADTQEVRSGKSITLDSVALEEYNDCTIEWASDNTDVATVENGVVTGQSKGTATITANWMRNNETVASDSITIDVLQEKGQLIADFTFDDDARGFSGAGAVANKADNAENLTIENIEGRGGVLVLQGQYNNPDLNYLDVKKEDGSSLLGATEEFTVSYDAISEGAFQNCWIFSVDDNGEWNHMSIADYPDNVQAYTFQSGTATGTHGVYAEGVWKHVDVVFGVNDSKVYIDGKLIGWITRTATVQQIIGNNSFMYIGKSTNWKNEYWSGKLDNFKIYNYALTAREVADEFAGKEEADKSALQAAVASAIADTEAAKYTETSWAAYTTALTNAKAVLADADATQEEVNAAVAVLGQATEALELKHVHNMVKTDAVEATCTEAGNIEYYTCDGCGKYFADAAGEKEIEADSWVTEALGHSYKTAWNWVKIGNSDNYTVTATITCVRGDMSETKKAEISSEEVNDKTVYTATVEFEGETYTSVKTVENAFTLTVENGKVVGAAKDNYTYGELVTVQADKKEGQYFEGWYAGDIKISDKSTYQFYVTSNVSLTAKYADVEVEEQAFVSLQLSERTPNGEKDRVQLTAQWSLPKGCKLVSAGIKRGYNLENADAVIANGTDKKSVLKTENGTFTFAVNMGATSKVKTLCAVAYVNYTDAQGNTKAVYSPMMSSPAN